MSTVKKESDFITAAFNIEVKKADYPQYHYEKIREKNDPVHSPS